MFPLNMELANSQITLSCLNLEKCMIIPAELIFKELFTSEFYCLFLSSSNVFWQAWWWGCEWLGQLKTEAKRHLHLNLDQQDLEYPLQNFFEINSLQKSQRVFSSQVSSRGWCSGSPCQLPTFPGSSGVYRILVMPLKIWLLSLGTNGHNHTLMLEGKTPSCTDKIINSESFICGFPQWFGFFFFFGVCHGGNFVSCRFLTGTRKGGKWHFDVK